MTKVLLLEDDPSQDSHFEKTFGEGAVDSFRTVDEVASALNSSTSWNFAFLDFDLGRESCESGLSAFALLKQQSPRTRLVGFTSVGENSRDLFAVAAFRWFGMWGLVHKSDATSARLRSIIDGRDRMPSDAWHDSLVRDSWRVDRLFANKRWGRLWQQVSVAQAQPQNLAGRVPGETESYARKTFLPEASDAAVQFSEVFLQTFNLSTAKPQLILIEFVRQNYTFFSSPDLLKILDIARPWERTS